MRAEYFLDSIERVLVAQLAPHSVRVYAAADEDAVATVLSRELSDGAVCCLLLEEEEVADTEHDQAGGLCEWTLRVILQREVGLSEKPEASAFRATGEHGQRASFLGLATMLRGYIQRVRFLDRTDFDNVNGCRFLKRQAFRPGGARGFRALELVFRVRVILDMPVTVDGEVPVIPVAYVVP